MATLLASAAALDDLQASADYRRHLAGVLLEDCLAELAA
jgi:CO/xanthine dehydrogenase FAD-binding subunit